MHKALLPYFKIYSDRNGKMNIEQFTKFCRDFSIFPDFVSK